MSWATIHRNASLEPRPLTKIAWWLSVLMGLFPFIMYLIMFVYLFFFFFTRTYVFLFVVVCRLLFGGSIPHYFFQCLEWLIPGSSKMAVVKQLLFQRLIFTPIYQLFTLYTISRLEVRKYYQNFS